MSTLSMSSPRISHSTDVDARFDALVRTAVPAQREGHGAGFETVFDLDYGQPAFVPEQADRASEPVRRLRAAAHGLPLSAEKLQEVFW